MGCDSPPNFGQYTIQVTHYNPRINPVVGFEHCSIKLLPPGLEGGVPSTNEWYCAVNSERMCADGAVPSGPALSQRPWGRPNAIFTHPQWLNVTRNGFHEFNLHTWEYRGLLGLASLTRQWPHRAAARRKGRGKSVTNPSTCVYCNMLTTPGQCFCPSRSWWNCWEVTTAWVCLKENILTMKPKWKTNKFWNVFFPNG